MKTLAGVFADTRQKSKTLYKQDTNDMKKKTFIYADKDELISRSSMSRISNMDIKVISRGTVSTAYTLASSDNRVAMLNFADAKRPGGWVIEGATTQEENICRCTNLYETLVQQKCLDEYYRVNKKFGIPDAERHYIEPYTDTLIYSEDAIIFKDDETYCDVPVKHVDIITCPAPCGNLKHVERILVPRMERIVKVAYMHNVTYLILGAWGCGAFGQNPKTVAHCFKYVIDKYPVFSAVIFAIRDCALDRYNDTCSNYKIFKEILET